MPIHRAFHHKMHMGEGEQWGPDQLLLWEQSDLVLHCLPSPIYPKVGVCGGNKGSLIVFPHYSVIYLILVSDYLNRILVDDF